MKTALLALAFLAMPALAAGPCRPPEEIPAQLINGWQNYGGPFKPASYSKDCVGVIRLSGGIRNPALMGTPGGVAPANFSSVAFVLPVAYRAGGYEIFPTAMGGDVHLPIDGSVVIVGGSSELTMLSGITYTQ